MGATWCWQVAAVTYESVKAGPSRAGDTALALGLVTAPASSPSRLSSTALVSGCGQGWARHGSWPSTQTVSPAAPSLGRFSVDEGLTWSTHNFTSTSVFVDGLLSEPGDETLVMT